MADNFEDFQNQLAVAPPNAPSEDDLDAAKATASAQAAQTMADAASKPKPIPNDTPGGAGPKPIPNDTPRPGSFAYHLSNALAGIASTAKGAATMAAAGGATRALFSAVAGGLSQHAKDLVAAATPDNRPSLLNPLNPSDTATNQQGQGRFNTPEDILAGRDQAPPAAQKQPGLLSKVGSVFGDIGRGGSGRISGILNERQKRIQDDKQATMTANAQMLHEQALVHKMGNDAVDASIKDGLTSIAALTAPPPEGGEQVRALATGKTSDELNEMIKNKQLDPSTQTAFPDGKKLEGQWPDGSPRYRTTYSIIPLKGEVTVTPEIAKMLNETLGGDGNGKKYPTDKDAPLQKLPAVDLNAQIQKAQNAKINNLAFEQNYYANFGKVNAYKASELANTIMQNPVVHNAINANTAQSEDPNARDPFAIVKAYNALVSSQDPNVVSKLPANWRAAYKEAATNQPPGKDQDEAWKQLNDNYQKATAKTSGMIGDMLNTLETKPSEVEGKTPAFAAAMTAIINDPDNYTVGPDGKKNVPNEYVKRAYKGLAFVNQVRTLEAEDAKNKAAGKKPEDPAGDPSLSGEEYIKTLPGTERALVQEVGTGVMDMTRLDYLLGRPTGKALAAEIALAYPPGSPNEFDSSRVKQYVKAYQDFTSGKTAQSLNAASAVLPHLEELRTLNTDTSRIPGTAAYNAFNNKLDTISGELAAFYNLPKTDKEILKMTSTLGAFFNRDASILTQIQSMTDKLTAFENQWTNAAPSPAYEAKMPNISPKARQSLARMMPDFVQQFPRFAPPPVTEPMYASAPDKPRMMSTDGGKTWTTAPGQ